MSDKFITKYKKEQQDIVSKMEIHRKADESYYFGATKLLELSQRAWELFKNSQPDKKNELLKYLLANAQMDEKKLIPKLNKPFDVIYSCNKSGNWLPSPEILSECVSKISKVFESVADISLIRNRWLEVANLNF